MITCQHIKVDTIFMANLADSMLSKNKMTRYGLSLLLMYLQSFSDCKKLLDNWKFLSKLSPIKCHQEICMDWNTKSIEDYVKTSRFPKQIILSYKCKPNEEPIQFTFKGEIQNYKLNGSGKLRIMNKNGDQVSRYLSSMHLIKIIFSVLCILTKKKLESKLYL